MEKEQLVSLVIKAQNGDVAATNKLFNAFYNDLYYFALKTVKDDQLALDITQESFIEIMNNLGNLKEPAAFVTWAKQITYHQCTRYFKKKKDVIVDEDEDGNTIFDDLKEENAEFIPDQALDKSDFKSTILSILDELPEEQRSATMMYYFDEMSIREIAEIQGVSEGTVKSRLNYGRKSIKSSVEKYQDENGVKLYSTAVAPMFKWVFEDFFGGGMEPTYAERMAREISNATGNVLSIDPADNEDESEPTPKENVDKVIKPIARKIISGVVAAAIFVAGAVTATIVSRNSGNQNVGGVSSNNNSTGSNGGAISTPITNEYINDNNNTYDANAISVKPRHVYWQDGKLIAQCFVINGFSHSVYNISVASLSFNNGTVDIASGSFGTLENLTLAPYTHVLWTFEFAPDDVQNYGADLSHLICRASVDNNY